MLRELKNIAPDLDDAESLLVGLSAPDDAAVWRVDGERVLIATVDFFTPIVDDPLEFGKIAAANAISDIYAMGGEPFLALSVAAFPDLLSSRTKALILQGAAQLLRQAGAVLAGGHTVRDAELKYGLAVLGWGRESELITKGRAAAGDRIFLTKALGTGLIGTAVKRGQESPEVLSAALASMTELSLSASRAARSVAVKCGTDVSGFGLAGHALELAAASGRQLQIDWRQVPILPGARALAEAGTHPGGTDANRAAFGPRTFGLEQLSEVEQRLLFDPQTSGGLLLAVPESGVRSFLDQLAAAGKRAWEIGRVAAGEGLSLR